MRSKGQNIQFKFPNQSLKLSLIPLHTLQFCALRMSHHISMLYDSLCFHPNCSYTKQSFVRYDSDQNHTLEHQQNILPIHPQNFLDLYPKSALKIENHQIEKGIINKSVKVVIDQCIGRISKQIQQQFFSEYESYSRMLETEPLMDCSTFIQNLKSGNYELLQNVMNYRESKKQISFSKYLQYEKKGFMESNISKHFTDITDKIIDIFQVAFQNINQLINVKDQYEKYQKSNQKDKISQPSTKKPYKQQSESLMIVKNSQQQQQSVNQKKKRPQPKSKQIQKSKNKKINKKQKIAPQKQQFYLLDKNPSQQIFVLSLTQIKVVSCTIPAKTINYIIDNYPHLTAIHIFTQKFARKQTLKKLIKMYPNLEQLTLNCDHQMESVIFQQCTQTQFKKFKNLELRWDFSRFLKQYNTYLSFPHQSLDSLKRQKSIHIPKDKLLYLSNNQTLWADTNQSLQLYKNRLSKLQTLHFARSTIPANLMISQLAFREDIRNLRTLHLRQTSFKDSPRAMAVIVERNISLSTVVIEKPYEFQNNADQILRCLQGLKFLVNFSLRPGEEAIFLDPQTILKLVSLEQLYLERINFRNGNVYSDSSCLSAFANLIRLQCLSLYACNPVFTGLFQYLPKNVIQQLQYLNIGATQVDSGFVYYMSRMPNLKYLNIDHLHIGSEMLLQACHNHNLYFGKSWGLKYLSMEDRPILNIQSLKQLGGQLHSLQYLDISQCLSAREYNFQHFPKLKMLALDQDMNKGAAGKETPKINKCIF